MQGFNYIVTITIVTFFFKAHAFVNELEMEGPVCLCVLSQGIGGVLFMYSCWQGSFGTYILRKRGCESSGLYRRLKTFLLLRENG